MRRKKITSIREALDGKVWKALQAMCDGLEKQSKRRLFSIESRTYGMVRDGICFGCMATCSVQEVFKVNFHPKKHDINSVESRAEILGYSDLDLMAFESAINQARSGFLSMLFSYMKKPRCSHFRFNHRFRMKTENWKDELPKVRELIKELKELDL